MIKRSIFMIMILTSIFASYADIQVDIEIEQAQIRGGYFTKDLPLLQKIGAPELPYYPAQVLLPQGEEIESIEVVLTEEKMLRSSFDVKHTIQQPISNSINEEILPDKKIYQSNKAYPYEDYKFLGVQKINGYSLAVINIYPYKYNPVLRTLNYYKNVVINIKTKKSQTKEQVQIIDYDTVVSKLNIQILNQEAVSSYQPLSLAPSRNINLQVPHKMVIITSQNLIETMQEYANWRTSQNISTLVVALEDIYINYNGLDNQAKIKNFIRDAYNSWATSTTPLEYVLLGGDDEIVPYRGVYGSVGGTVDYNMPSDLYYACLDGSWDDNGNGIYVDNSELVDLVPEIAVGRIPAETPNEFNNVFNKIISYSSTDNYADNIALMIGENLNNDPVTWGGDYKDEIKDRMPAEYLIKTRYQRDGNYSSTEVVEAINNNVTIMNHMGHANENTVSGLNSAIARTMLTNTQYGFLYTQGCYPAAFDSGTSGGTNGLGESVAEKLVIEEHGLHTFIGNTRYGWYAPGTTNGASQFFDRSFFDAMFIENIREIGLAHKYSLSENMSSALESSVMKWCYLEIVIFGDPSLAVKEYNPELAYIGIESIDYNDVIGDGDGTINPGETIEIELALNNLSGWGSADYVEIGLEIEDERFEVINNQTNIGPLPTGSIVNIDDNHLSFQVAESVPFAKFDYTLDIIAYNALQEVIFSQEFDLNFDITLMANNFPQEFFIGSKSASAYLDYNDDGQNEILYLDTFGNIKLVDLSGQLILDQESDVQENIYMSYALTEYNNQDVIVYASRSNNLVAEEIGGEVLFRYDSGSQFITSPLITDINGDGEMEIIAINFGKDLIAISLEGEILNNFPVELDNYTIHEMAVADLDADGKDDILVATNDNQLHAINYLGQHLANYPVTLPAVNMSSPIITNNRIVVGSSNRFYSLSYQGDIMHEFEVEGTPIMPIASDFNNDDYIDYGFVTNSRNLYIVSENGEIFDGFPVQLEKSSQTPCLAVDVNADGLPEIISFDNSNKIYIFDYEGNSLENYPFSANLSSACPATIGDLYGEGELSIILSYSRGVGIANLKSQVNYDTPSWMTYRNNYHRTGFLDTSFSVDNDDNDSEVMNTQLAGNYPNPFNPETTIKFSLAKKQSVKLDIFNIKGQKVTTLLNKNLDKGNHSIVWKGIDAQGRKVASGLYLYRLSTENHQFNRKMILMK